MASNGAKGSFSKNVTEEMIEKEKAQMRLDIMMDELKRLEKTEKQKKEKENVKTTQTKEKSKEKQQVPERKSVPNIPLNSNKAASASLAPVVNEDKSSSEDTDYEDDDAEARGYRVIYNNRIAAPTELKEEVNYLFIFII